MCEVNSVSRYSRQESNFILQDEFVIPGSQSLVQVKLNNDALTWTTSAKRGFVLKRFFSDTSTLAEDDDQHLISLDHSHVQNLRASQSCPNGYLPDKRTHHRLNISDIVGCDTAKGDSMEDQACYLRVYAYPLLRKFLWKDTVRKRKEIVFAFNRGGSFQSNHEEMEIWKNEIKKCIRKYSALDSRELKSTECFN